MIKKNENIVMRKIHGSCFLIDISDKYLGDKCSMFEINETGEFIWNSIFDGAEIDEVAKSLQDAIVDDVDYEMILSDVTEYVQDLCKKSFLEVT